MERFSLDFDREIFKNLLDQTTEIILKTHKELEERKVFNGKSVDSLRSVFDEPLPSKGSDLHDLMKFVEEQIVDNATFNIGPHFYSYVLSPSNQAGMAGDFINTYLNQNAGKWHLGNAAVEIEKMVIKWLAEFIGFSGSCGGLLVSGGSMANLTCLNVARNVKAPWDIKKEGLAGQMPMTIYVSDQVHYCIEKSCFTLGIGSKYVRRVQTNDEYEMDIDALKELIDHDIKNDLIPFCVVGNGGTVNTGVVDPLIEIATVCKQYDLWFHIDAAYGGPASALESQKEIFAGIELADSIAMDPHKWLYVPIEAGCALVKKEEHLRETFSFIPEYLELDRSSERTDYMEYGLQLTRNFKALKIWMTFKAYGTEQLKKAIGLDIQKAKYVESQVKKMKDFEVLAPAKLSITCFRYKPIGLLEPELNEINNKLVLALEDDGRVFITGTTIKGKKSLRVCIINHRTQQNHLDFMLNVVQEVAATLLMSKIE